MSAAPDERTTYAPGRPVPLLAIIGPLRHGAGDPTFRSVDGSTWLGQRTPEGPATLRLDVRRAADGDVVEAAAWGPGARWAVAQVPELLGDRDDLSGFVPAPEHPVLRRVHRERPHWRVPRSGLVVSELVPVVVEQRVTGRQAFQAYRRLVRGYGEPAPGPGADLGLLVQPTVAQWRRVPSWVWLRAGVDAQRADTVMRALAVAPRLAEITGLAPADARRRLRLVPGIGVWTAAEIAQRALGDADAVSVGDYHVAKHVTHALEGVVGDDARMLELLRPYAGHRFRVQRLLETAGVGAPRRGPRITLPTHLPQ